MTGIRDDTLKLIGWLMKHAPDQTLIALLRQPVLLPSSRERS